MKKHVIFVLIFICTSATASAYTRITDRSGRSPKWTSTPISYWINALGSPQISNGSEFNAIHAAFGSWQNVPTSSVTFNYRGVASVTDSGRDGLNLVTFSDGSFPLGSSTIAVTLSWFGTDVNRNLVTEEADIVFSGSLQFSTSGESGKFDIQAVMTHEIGHLLGLDHSGMISSVMVPFAAASQTDQRTLAYDDMAGISEIYSRPVSQVGQIGGTVQLNGNTIFGAHVVAVDQDGTPLVSSISQPDGAYLIRFVPPGRYRVYAEPLDLPVANEHIGGASGWYRNLRTDFGVTYFGNVSALTEAGTVDVVANNTATADINVLPRSAGNLNLTRPGFALRVSRGSNVSFLIGGEDITAGVSIAMSNPGLVLGPPTFGRTFTNAPTGATMLLGVGFNTSLGPKNVSVIRGGDASVVTGAIVVTDPPPTNLAISPNSGTSGGGTPVTITGGNFRAVSGVFFGGIPATDVRQVNSGVILATAPGNSPSLANVQVFNSDGTAGVLANGYRYFSNPPTISGVFPQSGPPSTVVTIEGSQFDNRTQNIEVRFGGAIARVVSSTSNTIQAIVPFGTTSGPITVSVFGQSAVGPDFTVTLASASTNVAGYSYNFIDATPAGGGANISFNSFDDAVAFVNLPFNFSLFRDIYLAGSTISISTNGWISLETVTITEFQNSSLPAQTVTRPGGSPGTVPPSLIAPYWDDLYLKTGISAVSMRTVGEAPNRQFVVQWSRVSILDEAGTELNAALTFEMILFEGSNDIQFVYHTLSGPRSDGSSATIGAQDLKRLTGIQTSFNQAGSVRSSQFVTYRFDNGNYTADIIDSTAPTRPVVTDSGALTSRSTELTASWTSEDPESGIREYQYAVGTSPGGVDIRPFTTTNQSSAVVAGLTLAVDRTYYFAVRAVNKDGLTSEVGISDGIRFDATFQSYVKIIPAAMHGGGEFGGIALLAPAAMSVTLKAIDSNGLLVSGAGLRNPVTINMTAGQQFARLISQLFEVSSFDGWIEIEASGPGLGVFSAQGDWNMSYLDGAVAGELQSDFMLFHTGGSAVIANPSMRSADVLLNGQSFVIPARNRMTLAITAPMRLQSSEGLAVIERVSSPGKLGLGAPVAVSNAASTLVFPHAVVGAGYDSVLRIANVQTSFRRLSVSFAGASAIVGVEAASTLELPLGQLLGIDGPTMRTGAVHVTQQPTPFGPLPPALTGVLDIRNATGLTILNARDSSTSFSFAHVAHGNGLFTGLCFATGNQAANITIEVYDANGGVAQTATLTLPPNQQAARLINEFVPGITTQLGGYIRVRSDQPIWAWEIYGSDAVMASAPPQ